jgi:hypothetical protein
MFFVLLFVLSYFVRFKTLLTFTIVLTELLILVLTFVHCFAMIIVVRRKLHYRAYSPPSSSSLELCSTLS